MFGSPAALLGMWSPWLVGAATLSGQLQEGLGALASEWQKFVGRRLKEDFAFTQRVTQSNTPDRIWAAQVEFWQRAMEDYSKESLIIGRLAAGVTSKAVLVAQSATKEASEKMLPMPKAA
jgi:hypothetical protein